MDINTEHLHHWMNAIRQSNNPMRTLDAFWGGQIKSKEWLIANLDELVHVGSNVEIHGGWVGTLASMLFQSNIPVKNIRSVDIDPHVQHIAEEMNRIEFNQGRFTALTQDMTKVKDYQAEIVINTSCEHITQEQYDEWLANTPDGAILVLQGNNYDIPEHIRISKDIHEFEQQCHVKRKFVGTLQLPLYERYMIIGEKIGN
jgi:hypothetical protein